MKQTDWANLYEIHRRVSRYARPRALDGNDFADLEMLDDALAGTLSFFAEGLVPDDPAERVRQIRLYCDAIRGAMFAGRIAEERDLLISGFMLWSADLIASELGRGHAAQ